MYENEPTPGSKHAYRPHSAWWISRLCVALDSLKVEEEPLELEAVGTRNQEVVERRCSYLVFDRDERISFLGHLGGEADLCHDHSHGW